MLIQFVLHCCNSVGQHSDNNTVLTVNTSFSNQVSVEFGIHADLCIVHTAYLLGESRKKKKNRNKHEHHWTISTKAPLTSLKSYTLHSSYIVHKYHFYTEEPL